MDIEILTKLVLERFSQKQIAKYLKKDVKLVRLYLRKYGLKTCPIRKIPLWTKEQRKLQSERKKKLYKDHPEKHPGAKLANNKSKMSYPEKLAYCFFEDNNFNFKHSFSVGPYFADFLLVDTKQIIEVDGEYWHKDNKEQDKKRDEFIESQGYKVVRFPAKEIIARLNVFFNKQYKISKEESEKRLIIKPKKEKPKCIKCNKILRFDKNKMCKNCWYLSEEKNKMYENKRKVKNRPSKEELEKLISNNTYIDIAKSFNVSKGTIKNWINQYFIKMEVRKRKIIRPNYENLLEDKKSMTLREMGKKYGVNNSTISYWINNPL
jgi:very-short-patch-repair endonuclease